MPKIDEKNLQGLIPVLKNLSGVDPRLELRLNEAFRRIYEIMVYKLSEQQKEFERKLQETLNLKQQELNSLIGILSQPLVGSGTSDPQLQSIISSYGPQSPNHFLAGPTPSFRAITSADLPNIIATQINADGEILDINQIIAGEYLKRVGNAIVSGFPVGTSSLAEATLPDAEGILYTTPVNYRTKLTNILLYNNSAGALVANILMKDPADVILFSDNYNLASLEKIIVPLNLILPANYTFRGFTSAVGAIEFSIFGIEEVLT